MLYAPELFVLVVSEDSALGIGRRNGRRLLAVRRRDL